MRPAGGTLATLDIDGYFGSLLKCKIFFQDSLGSGKIGSSLKSNRQIKLSYFVNCYCFNAVLALGLMTLISFDSKNILC